ncbi:hypothetical protein IKN40_02240 [bacterium]|nr:hypothetical protein [bacterium]
MKLLQPDFDRYCTIEQTLNNIKLDYKKSFDLYIKNFNSLESSNEFPISDNHKF